MPNAARVRTRLRAAWLGLVAAPLLGLALAAGNDGAPAPRAELRDDARRLVVRDAAGSTLLELSTDAWQRWAEPRFETILEATPRIGDIVLEARDFDRFGMVVVAPDGSRVAFSVTSYAVLTTVSLVGTLDLDGGEIRMVRRPKTGSVEQPTVSPSGRYLAYALGTARAAGEGLRVDDLRALREVARVTGDDVLEAAGRIPSPDGPSYLPHLRELAWPEAGVLRFASDPPGAGVEADRPASEAVTWRLPVVDGGPLRRADDAAPSRDPVR